MKRNILTAIIVIAAGDLTAQNKAITDTTFHLPSVEVSSVIPYKSSTLQLNLPSKFLPVSVSSVPYNNLSALNIIDLKDAMIYLPGVSMRSTYSTFQSVSIRGFGFSPVMIDGVRDERTSISNSAPFPDLTSVESIELVKGPASVLFGHSTVGGIVNVVRKAPTAERVLNFRMNYGSWDNKNAGIDLGGKVYKTLNYRATAFISDNEGYRHTNNKRFSGYLALATPIGVNQNLEFRGGFYHDKYGTDLGLAPFMHANIYNADGTKYLFNGDMLPGTNKRWRYNNESDFMTSDGFNTMLKYNLKVSDALNIENRLAYNYDDGVYSGLDNMGYLESSSPIYKHYYMKGDNKVYINLDSLQFKAVYAFKNVMKTVNNELDFSGKFYLGNSMKYNYFGGYSLVYMTRDVYKTTNPKNFSGPGFTNISSHNPQSMGYVNSQYDETVSLAKTITHGIFLQNVLELSDRFKLMLAGRYDYFDYQTATATLNENGDSYRNKTSYKKIPSSAFTYRAGAVYLPTSDLSVYASFANFYAPYRDVYSSNTIYIDSDGKRFYPKDGDEIFKPQTGYQTELGTRYTYKNVLQLTGSLFYIKKNNEKKTLASNVEDPEDNNTKKSVVGQVGTSDSKGFDLEAVITPIDNMFFKLSYSYTDAKIRKIKKNKYIDKDVDEGSRLAGVVPSTFSAMGNYMIGKGAFRNLGFNFGCTFTDTSYRPISKTAKYDAHWLTDLGAYYKLDNGVKLAVLAKNIFNETYYVEAAGMNARQLLPGDPASFVFSISYSLK